MSTLIWSLLLIGTSFAIFLGIPHLAYRKWGRSGRLKALMTIDYLMMSWDIFIAITTASFLFSGFAVLFFLFFLSCNRDLKICKENEEVTPELDELLKRISERAESLSIFDTRCIARIYTRKCEERNIKPLKRHEVMRNNRLKPLMEYMTTLDEAYTEYLSDDYSDNALSQESVENP